MSVSCIRHFSDFQLFGKDPNSCRGPGRPSLPHHAASSPSAQLLPVFSAYIQAPSPSPDLHGAQTPPTVSALHTGPFCWSWRTSLRSCNSIKQILLTCGLPPMQDKHFLFISRRRRPAEQKWSERPQILYSSLRSRTSAALRSPLTGVPFSEYSVL